MNQQPDKLFREKLESYQKTAPASAWEKIAAVQTKKNDKWLWLKIAASVTVVAAAGYLLLPETKTVDLTQKKPEQTVREKASEKNVPRVVERSPETQKTETRKPMVAPNNNQNQIPKSVKTVREDEQRNSTEDRPENKELLPVEPEKNADEKFASNETAVQSQQIETLVNGEDEPKKITLVYTAKDIEEYLDKKSLAEATSDNKKSSTLKKLLKKANDLTNNQDPFGELRQKKNEILALNFKNEKRGQNK